MNVLIGLVLFSLSAVAGGYYQPSIDTYDAQTNLYFKSVEFEKKSGFLSGGDKAMTNLYIYNPKTKEGKLVFPEKDNFQIIGIAFEEALENGSIRFNGNYVTSIKNNKGIAKRSLKSTMLIITQDTESKKETFYFANKDGTNLVKVRSIAPDVNWHIDVKNSNIMIVRQIGQTIKIESFAW